MLVRPKLVKSVRLIISLFMKKNLFCVRDICVMQDVMGPTYIINVLAI